MGDYRTITYVSDYSNTNTNAASTADPSLPLVSFLVSMGWWDALLGDAMGRDAGLGSFWLPSIGSPVRLLPNLELWVATLCHTVVLALYLRAELGEEPTTMNLQRQSSNNLLIVGQDGQAATGLMMATSLA